MPRDGSNTYSLPQAAFVTGTTITSTAVNSNFSDIAIEMTASFTRAETTAFTRTVLDDADAATARATLAVPVELIERRTVTTSSAADFVLPSGYLEWEIVLRLTLSADAQVLLRSSTDGGSSFASGSSDYQSAYIFNSGASGTNIASAAASAIFLTPVALASQLVVTKAHIITAAGFVAFGITPMVQAPGSGPWEQGSAAGVRNSATVANALRILPSSGTMTGTIALRGFR